MKYCKDCKYYDRISLVDYEDEWYYDRIPPVDYGDEWYLCSHPSIKVATKTIDDIVCGPRIVEVEKLWEVHACTRVRGKGELCGPDAVLFVRANIADMLGRYPFGAFVGFAIIILATVMIFSL